MVFRATQIYNWTGLQLPHITFIWLEVHLCVSASYIKGTVGHQPTSSYQELGLFCIYPRDPIYWTRKLGSLPWIRTKRKRINSPPPPPRGPVGKAILSYSSNPIINTLALLFFTLFLGPLYRVIISGKRGYISNLVCLWGAARYWTAVQYSRQIASTFNVEHALVLRVPLLTVLLSIRV